MNMNQQKQILSSSIPVSSTTPMIKQYLLIKSVHQDYLLFYRLGDFYELFFDDAKIASKILNIVLTKRGKHNCNNIPMCGVPYHSVTQYINRLLQKGYSVAICEQLESPQEAKKRGYKSVVKRDVVRIITPGTVMDNNLLDSKDMNFLMSIVEYKNTYAIAWIELTIGDFCVSTCSYAQIINEISRLQPKEILIPQKLSADLNLLKLQNIFTTRSDNIFDYKRCVSRIEEYYGVSSINSLGNYNDEEIIAAGSLIDYITYTQKNYHPKLKVLKQSDQKLFMEIDASTRRNLELTRGQIDKEFNLLNVIDYTMTSVGARLLKKRLNNPLYTPYTINKRLDCVKFFYDRNDLRNKIREYLKYFPDIERASSSIFIDKALFKNLNIIKKGLQISRMISEFINNDKTILTDEISLLGFHIFNCNQLLNELDNALIENEDFEYNQKFIKTNYNQSLDKLYVLKNNVSNSVNNIKNKYRNETGIQNLKISKNNVFGYFIEIANSNISKVDNSIFIHKQTLGNTTKYFTNELKELEILLINCENKIDSLECEILSHLCDKVKHYFDEISISIDSIANLDFFSALAHLAIKKQYTRPIVDESNTFSIKGGRHPIVEHYQKRNFISNSTYITKKEKMWLITGPNMAGKSTFLRQNALICILSQIGSYVPATKMHIGVVDKLFSRIGAADNIAKGESTFMVEMIETAYIINNATKKSLVILDEIGRGTSTYDGIAIAWGVLYHLHDIIKCKALFATHYHELTQLSESLSNIGNYTIQTKEWNQEIIFLYKIISGVSASSHGITVAKAAGIPKSVIYCAQTILNDFKQKELIKIEKNNQNMISTEKNKILNILHNIDCNNLSPIQSQKLLVTLKNSMVAMNVKQLKLNYI